MRSKSSSNTFLLVCLVVSNGLSGIRDDGGGFDWT